MTTDEPRNPVEIGDVVAGKYRIEEIVGVGGMGVVFAAEQVHLGRRVALKFLLTETTRSTEAVSRFLREARASASLESEHIARVLDVGTLPEGDPYIVMELLRGRDLGAELEARGPLPLHEAIDHLLAACRALSEAHRQGLVHRDLKPRNLFLAERLDGTRVVKLLDFGISKVIEGADAIDTDDLSTARHTLLGSPPYMSPEQLRSAKEVDARSDLWSVGVILYELLTGTRPFAGSAVIELWVAVTEGAVPSACALRPELPPAIDAILARCLAKSPSDRFADADALAAALTELSADLRAPTTASAQTIVESSASIAAQPIVALAPSTIVRSTRRLTIAGVLAMALLVGVMLLAWRWSAPAHVDAIATSAAFPVDRAIAASGSIATTTAFTSTSTASPSSFPSTSIAAPSANPTIDPHAAPSARSEGHRAHTPEPAPAKAAVVASAPIPSTTAPLKSVPSIDPFPGVLDRN